MTWIEYEKRKCAICETEDQYPIIWSISVFDSPNLDTRPPTNWKIF